MLETLGRYWWMIALRGLAAVIFGILALALPKLTIVVMVVIFGGWAFFDGALSLATGMAARRRGAQSGALVFTGIVGIVAGLVCWIWPAITAQALLVLIALWAILLGILSLLVALVMRVFLGVAWAFGLAGAALVILGILLFAHPMAGAVALAWLVGIFALIVGGLMIVLGFSVRARAGTFGGGGR